MTSRKSETEGAREMKPMRILITGINGLIGNILREALESKHEIYGLDKSGLFSDRIIAADIADYSQTSQAVKQFSPLDCIIHLAGNASMQATWDEVLSANIIGTRNIFEAAREHRVPRIIFASSNHASGDYEGFGPNLILHQQPEPPKISPYES